MMVRRGAMGATLATLFAGITGMADYPAALVQQGPVGYWRLNETIQPPAPAPAANLGALGATGNGTYILDAKKGFPGAIPGNPDTAARFSNPKLDATYGGSKVEIPYNPALNVAGPFSFEIWAKPSQAVPSGTASLAVASSMESGSTATARSGWLLYQLSSGKWQWRMGGEAGYGDANLIIGGTVTVGSWHHVVGTYDGSTAYLYVNGELVSSRAITSFVTNAFQPFRIGTTCFTGSLGTYAGNRGFDGYLDEAAYYNTALSTTTIKAHYDAALTNSAGYATQILASNPVGYWRLGEAGDPPAVNLGSLGAAADASFVSPAKAGQVGPRPAAFGGFEAANAALGLDGTGGFVEIPPLNLNTNTVTITAWVKPTGTQSTNASIVMCTSGDTVAGLKFDVVDANGLSYNWKSDEGAYNFKSDLVVPADAWSFVAVVVQPDTATLCLQDGTDFRTAVNYNTHQNEAFNGATRIGSDSRGPGYAFNGLIDEVAVFNRALSVGEVYSQYANATGGKAPKIFAQPTGPSSTFYSGDVLTLTVDAGGTAPLQYQWKKNNVDIPGATSSTYTKSGTTAADSGSYTVVVKNGSGQVVSDPVALTVETLSTPSVGTTLNGRTLYQGGAFSFSVDAAGGALTYYWYKDQTVLTGVTGSKLVVSSAKATDAGDYTLVVSNRLGTATAGPATIRVIVPATGTFEAAVVADAPEAWWRLDEPSGSVDMLDAMGRHDGSYAGNPTLGVAGIGGVSGSAMAVDGTESFGEVPFSSALNGQNFTIEAWANTTDVADDGCVVSSFKSKKGYFLMAHAGGNWWGCVGHNDQYAYYYSDMGAMTPGKWTHLVTTYDVNGLRSYVDGRLIAGPYGDFVRNINEPLRIGLNKDQTMPFIGMVDEVAVYTRALTAAQIADHYARGYYGSSAKPTFAKQPVSVTSVEGQAATLTARVEGSLPIGVQWTKNGVAIANATNETFTIASLVFSDNGSYRAVATNAFGSTPSDIATIKVVPKPAFCNLTNGLVLHLSFDADYKDSSGRGNNATAVGNPTLVTGAIGGKALHYSTLTDGSSVTEANYLTLGQPADLNLGTNVNFTVSYWVKLTGSPGDLPFLCSAVNSYSNDGITFAPSYQRGGWSWSLGSIGIYGGNNTINNGVWHHLLHSFDRAGNAITYLDGVQVDSRLAAPGVNLTTGNDVCIGQDPTGTYAEAGSADLDDLAIWKRALAPDEVDCLYTVGKLYARSFDTFGPVNILARRSGANMELIWQAGTLEGADKVDGPWTTVSGVSAPYYSVAPSEAAKFYRVKLK